MLKVNEKRLLSDLDSLAQIGRTSETGVSRLALSEADVQARAWFKDRAEAVGLQIHQDGAGNISALLPAKHPHAKTLLAGSHLDSVPNGGRFDGVVGVLSALEALRTIQEANLDLTVHLEAISFTDEEGTWLGLLGSRAFAGMLKASDLEVQKGDLEAFDRALARVGISRDSVLSARRDPDQYLGFVEAHIEQGRRMESASLQIAVVTNIVGVRWYWLRFRGEAAHAGTKPMDQRADAVWGASAFVERAIEIVKTRFSPGVSNFGQLHVKPGVFNIVPEEVRLALEIRHASLDTIDEMERALFKLADECAKDHHLKLETQLVNNIQPGQMDERMVQAVERSASELGLQQARLISFAFHDTQSINAVMPSVLYFVPSVNGDSHNLNELTHEEDVVNSANVMLNTLLALSES